MPNKYEKYWVEIPGIEEQQHSTKEIIMQSIPHLPKSIPQSSLGEILDISKATISYHLSNLKSANLIGSAKRGKKKYWFKIEQEDED